MKWRGWSILFAVTRLFSLLQMARKHGRHFPQRAVAQLSRAREDHTHPPEGHTHPPRQSTDLDDALLKKVLAVGVCSSVEAGAKAATKLHAVM